MNDLSVLAIYTVIFIVLCTLGSLIAKALGVDEIVKEIEKSEKVK